jgi:hypothetical protein
MLKAGDIKVKDRVSHVKRGDGTVVGLRPGVVDVQFDTGKPFAIRCQYRDLTLLNKRSNPRRRGSNNQLMALPEYIPATPRSSATGLFIFPRRRSANGSKGSFPIGDLYHARMALVYALSESHAKDRAKIVKAVQKHYGQYDWASWWDSHARDNNLPLWKQYFTKSSQTLGDEMRMVANPRRSQTPRNPFTRRDSMPSRQNPIRNNPAQNGIEIWNPDNVQFQATVQGVYESLIKEHVGMPNSAPFKDAQGVRLDLKIWVPQDEIQELLGQAFAIATASGQKNGYLRKGTQLPTKKGKEASAKRLKNKAKAKENEIDYEITLALSRETNPFRIVQKGKGKKTRYVVMPDYKEYKTERGARKFIERQLDLADEVPEMDEIVERANPELVVQFGARNMKPKRTRSLGANWALKLSAARAMGVPVEKVSFRSPPPMSESQKGPIRADLIQVFVYLPEMQKNGEPFLPYVQAPIASYYTIGLFGPSFKFNVKTDDGSYLNGLNNRYWRDADWTGYKGENLRERSVRVILNEEDGSLKYVKTTYRKSGISMYQFSPGAKTTKQNGFNPQAVRLAKNSVIKAYGEWFNQGERGQHIIDELLKSDKATLRYPSDNLEPKYDFIKCNDEEFFVLDPLMHIGVLIRACVALQEFQKLLNAKGRGYYLDISLLLDQLNKRGLTTIIDDSLKYVGSAPLSYDISGDEYLRKYVGYNILEDAFEKLFTKTYDQLESNILSKGQKRTWDTMDLPNFTKMIEDYKNELDLAAKKYYPAASDRISTTSQRRLELLDELLNTLEDLHSDFVDKINEQIEQRSINVTPLSAIKLDNPAYQTFIQQIAMLERPK